MKIAKLLKTSTTASVMERVLVATLLLCALYGQCSAQQNVPDFTKRASAVCTRSNSLLTFDVTLERNTDPVCTFKASDSNLILVSDNRCASNVNNYVSVNSRYQMSAEINMDNTNAQTSKKCGITEVFPANIGSTDRAFRLLLLCREKPQGLDVYGFHDALYSITCYSNAATSTLVANANVRIINPGFNQNVNPAPFSVTLHVMRFNPTLETYTEVTQSETLLLGEQFALEARSNSQSVRGIYLFNTKVSNNAAFMTVPATQDVAYVILSAADGCPVVPSRPYIPSSQFVQTTCNSNICVTRTGLQKAVQYGNTANNRVYFRSNIGPCLVPLDPKCLDYCTYNKPSGGRRKRSLGNETYSIETYVTLGSPRTSSSEGDLDDAVIIAVVTSCAVLLLVIATVVLCAVLKNKRRYKDTDTSSVEVSVESYGSKKQIVT